MRTELERRLGIRAHDVYGLSEIMGPGVAVECEARQGLHGWEDHFLFEVIDPATGAVLPPGAEGELVITTLTKEALPLIRYRTRDITRLETERCACGRNHVRIMRIAGRDDDMMIIRGVNVYPSQIEAALTTVSGTSPNYLLVRERKGALETLTVQLEPDPALPASAWPDLAQRVTHQVKSLVGVTVSVEPQAPGSLPRSVGKAARVRDLRAKG
jgi:phenylacetate-CoA ligase